VQLSIIIIISGQHVAWLRHRPSSTLSQQVVARRGVVRNLGEGSASQQYLGVWHPLQSVDLQQPHP
jgi:hypothetical protein